MMWLPCVQQPSEGTLCPELDYTVRRLVRGLASSRKGARQGYFITLTEVSLVVLQSTLLFTIHVLSIEKSIINWLEAGRKFWILD